MKPALRKNHILIRFDPFTGLPVGAHLQEDRFLEDEDGALVLDERKKIVRSGDPKLRPIELDDLSGVFEGASADLVTRLSQLEGSLAQANETIARMKRALAARPEEDDLVQQAEQRASDAEAGRRQAISAKQQAEAELLGLRESYEKAQNTIAKLRQRFEDALGGADVVGKVKLAPDQASASQAKP